MDQRSFVFATRGHCIKGKQCQHITIKNQNMCLCSKQDSLFSFYALPSGCKSKGTVVHCNLVCLCDQKDIFCLNSLLHNVQKFLNILVEVTKFSFILEQACKSN